MDVERIVKLLSPFLPSDAEQFRAREIAPYISTYIDILLRWNARMNLTAIRDPEEIVRRHFGESLFAAQHLFPSGASVGAAALGCPAEQSSASGLPDLLTETAPSRRAALQRRVKNAKDGASAPAVADLGSGAGFPGIPIKLWAPQISLTLIESNQKKSIFLREVARTLTLMNVDIQNSRAESLPQASFDVVTVRAVERFDAILPTAAALVAPGGRLALLIGSGQLGQAEEMLAGFDVSESIPIPESRSRVLTIARPGI
jgi:16S rRNA (guanine527-N7)-methyltransferase